MTISTDRAACADRITSYLAGGGLFNPELANHDAVRDLLIDCRAELLALRDELDAKAREVEALDLTVQQERGFLEQAIRRAEKAEADNAALRPDAERYRWLRGRHEHALVEVEDVNEDGWADCLYAAVEGELDAAIDAARARTE